MPCWESGHCLQNTVCHIWQRVWWHWKCRNMKNAGKIYRHLSNNVSENTGLIQNLPITIIARNKTSSVSTLGFPPIRIWHIYDVKHVIFIKCQLIILKQLKTTKYNYESYLIRKHQMHFKQSVINIDKNLLILSFWLTMSMKSKSQALECSQQCAWLLIQGQWFPAWAYNLSKKWISFNYSPLSVELRRALVIYWQKYVHCVLANYLGGLSLPRKRWDYLPARHNLYR